MTAPSSLREALAGRFSGQWALTGDREHLSLRHHHAVPRPRHMRVVPGPGAMLDRIESVLRRHGIGRADLLPLRWRRDTDLTISAVQALDPWLKDGAPRVWREGFLPQPVVRFTGERDASGQLKDGFLTSFVNVSCVRRVESVEHHVELIDMWIEVLSALGLHARRLRVHGDLRVWRRGPVEGITLFIDCDGVGVGDAVLLWHGADPSLMATDLGSGLERLRWVISGRRWSALVHTGLAGQADADMLDAVRTATLLLMGGVQPAARGAGTAVRRLARLVPRCHAVLGLSRAVRAYHAYWAEVGVRGLDWPHVTDLLEAAVLEGAPPAVKCA